MRHLILSLSTCIVLLFSGITNFATAQLVPAYTFYQTSETYNPGIPTGSTPAIDFPLAWDDAAVAYALPFNFTYNNIAFTTAGALVVSSNGWIAFTPGAPSITGNGSGGSWIGNDGVYLSGNANNNGIAGFNANIAEQTFTAFSCTITNGSPTLTGVPAGAFTNIQIGTRLTGTGIASGTVVSGFNTGAGTITMTGNGISSGTVSVTPRSSIMAYITGVSPNRSMVLQFTQVRRFGITGDNINFQIELMEGGGVATSQNIRVTFGNCSTSGLTSGIQSGLRGTTNASFNARTTAANWSSSSASAVNTDKLTFSSAVFPVSGNVYNWSPSPLPLNDNCINAIAITPNSSCIPTSGNSVNSLQQFPATSCSGFTSSSAKDVWYKFNADGSSFYSISVTGTNGFDPVLGLYSACGIGNLISCVDATAGNGTETLNAGILAAGTYYYRIYGWNGLTGTFNTCVVSGVACTQPVASPTGLNLIPATSSIAGSFTASSPAANGYLVIRTTSATPPSNPVNGITYVPGTSALGGTIEAAGAGTSFTSSALQPSTTYCYWIYSYNNTACLGGPVYRTLYLTGCQTTTVCGAITTKTWNGPATGGDFNTAANWTPSGVPTACNDVVVNISSVSTITLSAGATINSLSLTTSGGGQTKIGTIDVGNNNFTILTTTVLDAMNGSNQSILGSSTGGIISCFGNVTLGTSTGTGNPATSVGSGLWGTSATRFIFGGNLTFGPTSFVTTTPPGLAEFDGTGTQTITWNNTVFYANFNNVVIGNINNPVVNQVTGTITPDNIKGNLTINGNAVLNMGTSQWNRNSSGGVMTMNGTSMLKLAGNASLFIGGNAPGGVNVTGNNFPGGFSTYNLAAGSTVEYNSANGINQIVAPVTNVPVTAYGNLVLTNSSGSGVSTKSLSQNITGGIKGNLTINSFAVFDMSSFTANRIPAGGSFAVSAGGRLRLSGSSGGAGSNNNFPADFSSYVFNTTSNTDYYGGAQGISAIAAYGNLNMLNAGIKTAPAGDLMIRGNFTNAGSTFAHNNGRVLMNGSGNQSFTGVSYFNLDLSGSGIKSTSGNTSITDSLKLHAATNLTLAAGDTITMQSGAARTSSIGFIPAGATITYGTNAKFRVERYIPNHSKAWQFLAIPAIGQTVKDSWQEGAATPNANLRPGYGTQLTSAFANALALGFDVFSPGGHSMKTFNPVNSGWDGIASTADAVYNKKGYMVFVRGDRSVTLHNQAATSTIMRSTGTIYDAVSLPPSTSVATGQFESVGNPYASALNPDNITLTGGVARNFYVWDPKLTTGPNSVYGLGGYQTIASNAPNPGYTVVPGGGNYAGGNVNIESGQAFLVAAPFAGGTVSFTENAKVSGSNIVTRPPSSISHISAGLFTGQDILLDGVMNQYHSVWSNSVDIRDVPKLKGSAEMISIRRNGKDLSLERRNSIEREDTIFYRLINLKNNMLYSLVIHAEEIQLHGRRAFLEDLYLNQVTEINLNSDHVVSFSVNGEPSTYQDRFRIVFRTRNSPPSSQIITTKVLTKNNMSISLFPNPVMNSMVNLTVSYALPGSYNIIIRNKAGQLLQQQKIILSGEKESRLIYLDNSIKAGAYTLSISNEKENNLTLSFVVE